MRTRLTSSQLTQLRAGSSMAVLATADRHGRPHTAMVSWLAANSATQVQLAVDVRGQHFKNLRRNPYAVLQVLGDDLVLAVSGTVELVRERIESAPFPLAHLRILIDYVSDQSLAGVRFTGPHYAFLPDKQHRLEVEQNVVAELHAHADDASYRPSILVEDHRDL